MKRFAFYSVFLIILFAALLALAVPAWAESVPAAGTATGTPPTAAQAEGAAMDQMSEEEMAEQEYKPPEQRADDTMMATVVAAVFGIPVASWFIVRSYRKAKKN